MKGFQTNDSGTVQFRTGREIEREIKQLQLAFDGLTEADAYARILRGDC